MNKKTKLKLNETLNKALEPPRNRDRSKLDQLLNLYDVQEKPKLEIVSEAKATPNPTQDNPTQDKITQDKTTQHEATQPNQVEISPIKDFTKVPNSITKEAIPQKFFKGLSKHTYDILYRHTRGNIKPVRKIQLTKSEIMKLTGLSFNTVQTHIRYLKEASLVKVEFNIGKHEGSVYEIIVPEEIRDLTQPNSTQDNPTQDKITPKTQPDTTQKLGMLGLGKLIENKTTYNDPNTSLKTNTSDDEAFAQFIEKFQSVSRELTGKKLSKREVESLGNLADLLILELRTAARRTDGVSNIPSFLTEVLRRQFFASRQQQTVSSKQSKAKKDTVGKPEVESYEIKALNKQGREEALDQLREFATDDFLEDFQKWYTAEDWEWLKANLAESNKVRESDNLRQNSL